MDFQARNQLVLDTRPGAESPAMTQLWLKVDLLGLVKRAFRRPRVRTRKVGRACGTRLPKFAVRAPHSPTPVAARSSSGQKMAKQGALALAVLFHTQKSPRQSVAPGAFLGRCLNSKLLAARRGCRGKGAPHNRPAGVTLANTRPLECDIHHKSMKLSTVAQRIRHACRPGRYLKHSFLHATPSAAGQGPPDAASCHLGSRL